MSFKRYHFAELSSTRSWAKEHVDELEERAVVTTDFQTDGRGQFTRQWISPPGKNILATYLFRLDHSSTLIAQRLAFCAVEVLRELGLQPTFKLPNDLLLNGKKIAGALAETTPMGDYVQVLASIGLNVNMAREELAEIDQPATSIAVELGAPQDREAILEQISERLWRALDSL